MIKMVRGNCETEQGMDRYLTSGDGRKDFDTDVLNDVERTMF